MLASPNRIHVTPQELADSLQHHSVLSLIFEMADADRVREHVAQLIREHSFVRLQPRVTELGVFYSFAPVPPSEELPPGY